MDQSDALAATREPQDGQGEEPQQQHDVVVVGGDCDAAAAKEEAPPSALKGKSGRERSTDRKLRFDPDVTVIETPSYVLVMHDEEGEDEVEELAVFDRLYEEAKKRAERAKAESCSVACDTAEATAKECTFQPVVSDTAKQLGRYENWEAFLQSQEERRKTSAMHFQKKKDKLLSDDSVPLFEDMPRKHSLRIIAYLEKERKYKGPIRGWRERFRKYMWKLQEQEGGDSSWNKSRVCSDTFSVHSGVVCDGTVFDRLYEEAIVREAAQRVVIMTQLEKEARELYHPMTNESDYWMNLDDGSGNTSDYSCNYSGSCSQRLLERESCGSSVFEELYAKGEETRRRREKRVEEAMDSQPKFPFKPATNPQSSKIVRERAIARAKGELSERGRKKQLPEATVESSAKKSNVKFNTDIFCSRLQRKESERLGRLAVLRREVQMEEVLKCTFRPSISRKSEAIATQKGYGQITFVPSPHSSPTTTHPRTAGGFDPTTAVATDATTATRTRGTAEMVVAGNNTPSASHWADVSSHSRQESGVSFARRHANTPQRRRGGSGSRSNVGSVYMDENAGELVDARQSLPSDSAAQTNFIATLSSEIQGVLSEWSEAAEAALAV